MMKKHLLFLLLLFSLLPGAYGQYLFNENCREGWVLLLDLRFDEARQLMDKELALHPGNYYALYLEQTCDAWAMFINSDDKEYEAFIDNYDKRREIMDGKFENSPYYLMCKSEMDLQVGMFRVLHGSLLGGARKAYTGYRETQKNLNRYPGFGPSRMIDGFFNCALSNLPPFIKGVVSLFSVSSDFDKGWQTLEDVYRDQKDIKGINAESALFLIFVAKINKTPELVFDLTQSYDSSFQGLFMPVFFKANIEYRTGHNEQALHTLASLAGRDEPRAQLLYNYQMGKALLRKGDNRAEIYIRKFLKGLRKKDYLKEMTYKLALYHLLRGDMDKYHALCKVVREEGADIVERDHEALYDASLDYDPDVSLVRARLRLDGGYLQHALQHLAAYEAHPRQELPYRLEYLFLKGRYALATGDTAAATEYFQQVLKKGKNEKYLFASEAALRLGEISEAQHNYPAAYRYYQTSSDLFRKDYYEYIGSKAEKGEERVKGMSRE